MTPDPEILRAVAAAVARVDGAAVPSWRRWISEHVLKPIGELLRDAVIALARFLPSALGEWIPVLAWVTLGVALAGLVVLIARRLLRREGAARGELAMRDRGLSAAVATAEAAEAEARRLRALGDLTGAVRALYAALVIRLHAAVGAKHDPSLTPREVIRRFAASPERAAVREFVRAYERISFGGEPIDDAAYARLAAIRAPDLAP